MHSGEGSRENSSETKRRRRAYRMRDLFGWPGFGCRWVVRRYRPPPVHAIQVAIRGRSNSIMLCCTVYLRCVAQSRTTKARAALTCLCTLRRRRCVRISPANIVPRWWCSEENTGAALKDWWFGRSFLFHAVRVVRVGRR